jgi:acyl-coenzyme A synthetase/AMP-(fatty) acid ligase
MYGPTETAIYVSALRLERVARPVPLGPPIANTRFYVLDEGRRRQPPGVWGELYVAGSGVARGYRNRPELSARHFSTDPFDRRADIRMYRTGDRVRWRADGTLEFGGRLDDQVKLRGCRIEPGEIETVMRSHAAVREVVVRLEGDGPSAALIAYFTLRQPGSTVPELAGWLAQRLPAHMVPMEFVRLESLPLNANGKLDRARLQRPMSPASDAPARQARSQMEHVVERVWKDVLGCDVVGPYDNFFDLGGHSLLLARAHHRLRHELGREVSMVGMLEHPTVASLAAWLSQHTP